MTRVDQNEKQQPAHRTRSGYIGRSEVSMTSMMATTFPYLSEPLWSLCSSQTHWALCPFIQPSSQQIQALMRSTDLNKASGAPTNPTLMMDPCAQCPSGHSLDAPSHLARRSLLWAIHQLISYTTCASLQLPTQTVWTLRRIWSQVMLTFCMDSGSPISDQSVKMEHTYTCSWSVALSVCGD